jgi:hypothetical protein
MAVGSQSIKKKVSKGKPALGATQRGKIQTAGVMTASVRIPPSEHQGSKCFLTSSWVINFSATEFGYRKQTETGKNPVSNPQAAALLG